MMDVPVSIMLKLDDGNFVNALDVSRVKSDYNTRKIELHLRDGTTLLTCPRYKESVYDAEDRIVEHINHAAATYAGLFDRTPKFSAANSQPVAVSDESRWRYPANGEPAPSGVYVQLLTTGGVQVRGIWRDNGQHIAWAPMIKRDKELEQLLGLI